MSGFCKVGAPLLALVVWVLAMIGCGGKSPTSPAEQSTASSVAVTVNSDGPVVIKTSKAEFEILPSGYTRAYLLKDKARLTFDEPAIGPSAGNDIMLSDGREVHDFTLDFEHAKTFEAHGDLGSRGKRVEIIGRSSDPGAPPVEKTILLEAYDDFPNLLLTTVRFKNLGTAALELTQLSTQRHRLNASQTDLKAAPFQLWSFQGSSSKWGKDEVLPISRNFSEPNLINSAPETGLAGGVPIIAFWTAQMGEAIGHVENLPLIVSLPVKTAADGRVHISLDQNLKDQFEAGRDGLDTAQFCGCFQRRLLRAAAFVFRGSAAPGLDASQADQRRL